MKEFKRHIPVYLQEPISYIENSNNNCIEDIILRRKPIFMKEAVIKTDKYGKKLLLEFKNFVNTSKEYKIFDFMLKDLNVIFKKYNIEFINEGFPNLNYSSGSFGINEMHIMLRTSKIKILCNFFLQTYIKDKDSMLFVHFYDLISHELIHRGQMLSQKVERLNSIIENEVNRENKLNKKYDKIDNVSTKQRSKMYDYLSNKQEIMAYAFQSIEELRFSGMKDNDILLGCKNMSFPLDVSETINGYLTMFDKNIKEDFDVLKRYFKYIYLYLKGDETSMKELKIGL